MDGFYKCIAWSIHQIKSYRGAATVVEEVGIIKDLWNENGLGWNYNCINLL